MQKRIETKNLTFSDLQKAAEKNGTRLATKGIQRIAGKKLSGTIGDAVLMEYERDGQQMSEYRLEVHTSEGIVRAKLAAVSSDEKLAGLVCEMECREFQPEGSEDVILYWDMVSVGQQKEQSAPIVAKATKSTKKSAAEVA